MALTDLLQESTASKAILHLRSRPRRLRLSPSIRRLVRETTLTAADFIYPLFVRHGSDMRVPIAAMPGQCQLTIDHLPAEAKALSELGIPAVILFGIPAQKGLVRQRQLQRRRYHPARHPRHQRRRARSRRHLRYVFL